MNETNPLETQLRSWTPRRPSARIQKKIFRHPQTVGRPAGMVFWLGPVTACLLLVCGVLNQPGSATFTAVSRNDEFVAMILSNQSYAAYLPGSFQQSANRLDTFEWTNGARSTSFVGSLSPGRTND